MSSFKLLEIYFYPGPPGRAGENIFSICVSLIGILRVGIAKHHAVEVVSKSQPLKLNSERALTPTVHWHIRLADTVAHELDVYKYEGAYIGPCSADSQVTLLTMSMYGSPTQMKTLEDICEDLVVQTS